MSKLETLESVGCIAPEWFLRDHIPRHAEHYELSFEESFSQVVEECATLQRIQQANFAAMLVSGTAQRALAAFARTGQSQWVGERMLVVEEGFVYRMDRDGENQRDPLTPLSLTPYRTMKDVHHPSVTVGRPNAKKELVLFNDFTAADYDVVCSGLGRLIEAKKQGQLPHLWGFLTQISIPYTLGGKRNPEHVYDPDELNLHGPLEYNTVTIDPED